jgi:hypothetical protein
MPSKQPYDNDNSLPDDDFKERTDSPQNQDYDETGKRMTPSRMAGMLNFEEGEGRFGETNADIAAIGSEYEEDDPVKVKTKRGLESNPVAKMGLIGGVGLLVFAILATILSGIFFRRQLAVAPQATPTKQPQAPSAFRDPQGDYETELALARQKLEIEKLRNAVQPIRIVQPTPQPIPPPPVTPQPIREAIRPILPPPPRPLARPPAVQPKDPVEEWLAASTAGTAGQIERPEDQQASGGESAEKSEAVDSALETAVLTGQRLPEPVKLISGTKAKGVLATPVAWGADTTLQRNSATTTDRYIVTLNEPLKAADGSEALPANTQLITQMNSYSQDGLIDLSVVGAVADVGGQQQEIPISGKGLKVVGKKGEPLVAKMNTRSNIGGGFTAAALGQGLLGAANGAAEELTKADTAITTSTSEGGTTTSSSVSSNDTDVGAGVLKGGTEALLDVYTDRNRARLNQLSQQKPARIWVAKAGTQVEVFVTQSTEIPRMGTASRGRTRSNSRSQN